jgi:hypothetical protein
MLLALLTYKSIDRESRTELKLCKTFLPKTGMNLRLQTRIDVQGVRVTEIGLPDTFFSFIKRNL